MRLALNHGLFQTTGPNPRAVTKSLIELFAGGDLSARGALTHYSLQATQQHMQS